MEYKLRFRLAAFFMVICLVVTMMPSGVYALNVKNQDDSLESESEVDTSKEPIIEKDEYTTTYSIGKGQKKKVFHGSNVRFKDENGELVDYDPSLVALDDSEKVKNNKASGKYAFKNNKGDKKQYFPDSLAEDTPLIMENEQDRIQITPAQSFVDTYNLNNAKVKVEKEKVETIEGKKKIPVTAVYGNGKKVSIKYKSEDRGVKETIVFYERPESNVIEYKLSIGNLKARKNEHDKGITIFDSTEEDIVAGIEPAWMVDKKDAYSEDIEYEISPVDEGNGEYILRMILSDAYLNAKERKYPVTVDPTVTWLGSSRIRDVYVISGSYANTNFYSASTAVMPAGKNSTGIHETYLAFADLKSSLLNKNITSATLSAYEVRGSTNGQKVGVFISANTWNPSTLTFNNRPPCVAGELSSIVTQPAAVEHKFDVTKYAQKVAAGAYDYGLILKNITSNPQYAVFFGSRSSSTAYMPKLTVVYSDIPPLATSVQISSRYTSDSTKSAVSFSGLSGPDILRAEYKINEVKEDTKELVRTIYDFSEKTKITSGAVLPDIDEGTYEVFVRGVNKAGITGPEKSCGYVYVDKTKPVIGSVTLKDSKGNTIDKCTGDTNSKIEFSGLKDLHIDKTCIKYAIKPKGSPVADSDYKVPAELTFSGSSTTYSGSFRLLQEDRNLPSSEYVIGVRVTDFAQNSAEKRVVYTIDSQDPKGSIKIKDIVSGNITTELSKPVNIEVFADGTGSSLKESTLKMYKLVNDGNGGLLIDKSSEVLIDRNFTISKNIIFDTLDICDSYGKYRFVLFLKDSVGRTAEVSQDFDVVYKLPPPKYIEISPSNGSGKATVTWKFPHNIQQKIKLSELEIKYNEKEGFKSLVKADKDSTLPFEGSAEISVPKEEGDYNFTIRGKSQYGHGGSEKKSICIVDKTPPVASFKEFQQGYIVGTATDSNLKRWNIYVKDKGAEIFDEKPVASGTCQVNSYYFAFIDFNDSRFEKGKDYTFKLVAEDKSANVSEDTMDVHVPLDEPIAKLIPPELEIEKSSRYVQNGEMIVGTLQDSFRLTGNVVGAKWYINNILSGPAIRVNIENKICYTDCWNHILALKINKDNSRAYSAYVVENGIKTDIEFTSKDLKNGAYEMYSVYLEDVVAFMIHADSSLADYYIKTASKGNDVFTKVIPGEKYYVTELSGTSAVSKGFIIKAVPKPGKTVEGKGITVYSDSIGETTFLITKAEDYAPSNLTAEDKLNYKTYLKWDIPDSIPEDISYEVYRGTKADFVPDKDNLVAKDIKTGYFAEINAVHGETFYYKVCAVHKYKDPYGYYELRSSFSETSSSRVVDQNESLKRMGLGEQWEYADFSMVQADGYIEKSKGNFVYQKTDADIPNEGFDVCLKRTYNSQGSYNGIFGFGWSHDYDMELLNICENNSLAYTHVILKDGNGTIYHFTRNSSDEEFISSLGDYVNLDAEESESIKKVNISGSSGQKTVEVKYRFILTTKGGDLYYFNAGGQLVYMENQNGKFVVFEHDKKKGVLTKMTTNNNLSIDFIYNEAEGGANPLTVKEIRLPDKSKILYEYEKGPDSQILLRKVTEVSSDEKKISWTYEYDKPFLSSMPLNLVKVKDAKGEATYRLDYDYENDSVKEAVYPNGEKLIFSYSKDYTSTVTVKHSGGKVVLGEKDFFDRIYGKCEKSIRGVCDVQKLYTDDESDLDVSRYSYVDNKVVSIESTAEYQQIENDGFISTKKSVKKSSVDYRKDNPVKEQEDDGAISEYTYYTHEDGSYLEDMLKTIKEFDANGELSSYKKYGYDSLGNITEITDYVEGTKVVNTYYTDGTFKGELKSMKESLIRLDNSYNIIDESIKGISEYSYSYDSQGNLTKNCTQTVSDVNGKSESVTTSKVYDLMGRLKSDTDSRGYQNICTYDGFGRVINTLQKYDGSDNLKDSLSVEYDENSNVIYEKTSSGIEKWYTYDNMGLVTSTRVKKGADYDETLYTSYSYEDIQIYSGKGAEGKLIKNAYVVTESYSDGTVNSQVYKDHCGNVVRTYQRGIYTDMTYNMQGQMITKWLMGKSISKTEGRLELYIYDEKGNLIAAVKDPDYIKDSQRTGYAVRPDSSETKKDGSIVVKSLYDAEGNLIEAIDANGNKESYTYSKNGDLLSVTNADNVKYEYKYDVKNNDFTTKDVVIEPKLVRNGNSSYQTVAKSIVVKDAYDRTVKVSDLGISEYDDTSITTSYEYDIRDNMTKAVESNGNQKIFSYDARDRLISVEFYENTDGQLNRSLKTEYTYDDSDNMTSMTDKNVLNDVETVYRYTEYGYDGFNRLIYVSENDGDSYVDKTAVKNNRINYSYDGKDRLVSISYPKKDMGIDSIRFTYNSYGWLEAVNAIEGNAQRRLREYDYTVDGKISQITDFIDKNSQSKWIKKKFTYDNFERIAKIEYLDNLNANSGNVKESFSYEYDKNNNIVSEKHENMRWASSEAPAEKDICNSYDKNNRLVKQEITSVKEKGGNAEKETCEFSYDPAGNLILESQNVSGSVEKKKVNKVHTYNEFNQLISSREVEKGISTNTFYEYDANGNQVKKTSSDEEMIYSYDADNRLKEVYRISDGVTEKLQENRYNGIGQRIQKNEGGKKTDYYYDGKNVLYTENEKKEVTSLNVTGIENTPIVTIRKNGSKTEMYSYVSDIRSSTFNVLGKDGLSKVTYDYDAFGETKIYESDEQKPFYNEICFTGGIYDKTTKLYNMKARYYSPAENMFLTQDTYRGNRMSPETLNLYGYCGGNPASYTDPDGHAFWGVLGAALGAYDGYSYAKKKKLKGGKKALAIVTGALIGAVDPFKVAKTAKTGYKVYKAAKFGKKAVTQAKRVKVVAAVASKPKVTAAVKPGIKSALKLSKSKKAAKVLKSSSKRLKGACFTAGTKVHTKDGFKNIEAIKPGDYVWSENPQTNEKALKKVKKIFVREKDSIIRLAINGEVISTTDEHPFYVEGKGFVPAAKLAEGEKVRTGNGEILEVESVEHVRLKEAVKVYNFEVEDFHTYYVSGSKVLVHNTCSKVVNKPRKYWTTKLDFNEKRVYQRDDLIDIHKRNKIGLSNLQLMKLGRAPIGPDGKPINLHHLIQTEGSAVAEVTQTMHQHYTKILHINSRGTPSGINRIKFASWRRNYWKNRAKYFELSY